MPYVPHTDVDRKAMLAEIGVASVEELFADVPEEVRFPELKLPEPLSEMEVMRELRAMSERNADLDHHACFLGAGAYNHFVPSVVNHVIGRSEFYTAYTPYQPEISQGTLQTIFEYQTMVCALTGMEVANASHYDGATALAEAALMAVRISRGKRKKVIVSPAVHPEYRQTLRTYIRGTGLAVVGDEDLRRELDDLKAMLDGDTACLIVQNPNFFGQLEEVGGLAEAVHEAGALFIVAVDPISLGLFKPPGEYGADIVVGEGQSLGNAISFGGPYLGIFACLDKYKRQMPGRLVGETVDVEGRRGYVLTLTPREQHIRREKATSNICTNEALCALAAGAYLAAMGKRGLRKVAELCYHKAHYAAERIAELPGFELVGDRPFFKEFVVRCPKPPAEINQKLLEHKIIGGYELGRAYPHLADCMLLCVTEMNTKEEIDRLAEALKEVSKSQRAFAAS
ncbi:MAG TPA: aminomethyl-transferring glycine dehydrogenase subunit GcvPA [Anaerolineae bacterium]|nr:aminomethyl-transferring glycine dehydrogenase subunit GcvPA [Anaerolineae bacterium]